MRSHDKNVNEIRPLMESFISLLDGILFILPFLEEDNIFGVATGDVGKQEVSKVMMSFPIK